MSLAEVVAACTHQLPPVPANKGEMWRLNLSAGCKTKTKLEEAKADMQSEKSDNCQFIGNKLLGIIHSLWKR